ncbi:hypothetical protein ACHAXR_011251 [Thalassiosira sp. AJA248-18]
MKLLKSTRSFKISKKKSSTAVSSPNAVQSATNTASAPLDNDDPAAAASTLITPPSSPHQMNEPETRQDNATSAATAPVSPSTPSSPKLSKKNASSQSQLRPLRLGSFNFDNPNTNTSIVNGAATPQTHRLTFPSLYHEADDMLILSNLIYTLAELRDLARNGVLNNPIQSMRILEVPLPLDTALKIIGAEGELLREVLDDGKHEATLSSLESLLERQKEQQLAAAAAARQKAEEQGSDDKNDDSGMFGWMTNWDGCLAGGFSFDELFCGDLANVVGEKSGGDGGASQHQEVESSMITAVGDLKANDELVYAVGINPAEERITVVFRGSVTKNDFMTDAKISIVQAPDPRKFNGTESEDMCGGDVGVHQGFYDYLFGESNGKPSKYAEITKHVAQLLNENPTRRNYKLYITGHSLGGALATLFGFYAAASTSLPLPVTIVSVASPRVGNIAFARTFAEMESQGKLRHLRIANHKDPVTLGPTVSSKRALALSAKAFSPLGYLALIVTGNGEGGDEEVYYHTGMKMKLYKNVSAIGSQRFEMSYSGATIISGAKKPVAIDQDDMVEIEQSNRRKKKESSAELPMVSYHYGTSYSERMSSVESDLMGLTLNNLYREKASVMPWVV